jgi:S1-C subfamily serine protease
MLLSKIRKNQIICWTILSFLLSFPISSRGQEGQPAAPAGQDASLRAGAASGVKKDYSKEIMRKGRTVIISRVLADKIKEDNSIVMAAVTVKASLDRNGKGNGYKIVAVDKGSLAQKLGVVKNDVVQEVNGQKLVSSDDVKRAEEKFKDSNEFEVKIIRKGRSKTLYYAIR